MRRKGLPTNAGEYLLGVYQIADHQENDPTGFSATLWQSKEQSSQYVLSIRGTDEALQDTIIEDGLYVFRQGYARRQLVAVANYYNRLIAPEGSPVTQLRIIETAQPSARLPSVYDRLSGRYITLIETAPATGLGAIPAGAGISLDVTGHSLGAHLTLGFSRLFPSAYSAATTFNAPGYEPVQEVDDFFRALGGAAQFPLTGVTNLDGLEGPLATSIISDLRRRPKPGGRQFVFIEDQIDAALALQLPQLAFNHSQSLLTDSMGLYALFERIDPAAGIERITGLLKAASNRSPRSLEAALDGLRALFRADGWSATTPLNRREAYFANLFALDDLLAQSYPNGAGSLLLASELEAAVFAQRAKEADGLAYRYALRTLNPYVVAGADTLPAYAAEAGSLVLAATGDAAGGMTGTWIDRRSELLARLAERNSADRSGQHNIADYAADPVDYRWTAADGVLETMRFAFGLFAADDPRVRQVAFGSARGDLIRGSNKDDSLFGESGNDTLIGLAGVDHLEGGAGNDELIGGRGDDLLAGGAGFDTYVYALGDGQDRILDEDRSGRIVLDTGTGRIALGLLVADADAPNVWRSADASVTLTHNSPWTLSFADGGSIVLGDLLEAGDFGLRLDSAPESADGYFTLTWDDNPYFLEFDSGAERDSYVAAYQAAIAADTRYLGGEDADNWYDLAGSNRVELGDGSDLAVLGAGDDVVLGGEGRDTILGGAGDDSLYGGDAIDIADAIASEGEATGEPGDMLADRAGDDWLIGANGDDLISGGLGNDLLIGAPGDDHIYGDDYFPLSTVAGWSFPYDFQRNDLPRGVLLEARYRDTGSGGNDEIHGGSGNDWVNGGSGDDTVYGDAGDDFLVGGEGSDAIFGGDGDDVLRADGADTLVMYDDPDFLDGGAGDDFIVDYAGDNLIFGGEGDDYIYVYANTGADGAASVDLVHGGAGNDDITAAGELHGDDGDDLISGSAAGDRIYGGAGNDLLMPGGPNTLFDGGEGDDVYALALEGTVYTLTDASGFDTIELHSGELSDNPDLVIADSSLRLALEDGAFVLYYGALGDRVVFADETLTIEQVRILHEYAPGEVGVSLIALSSLPVLSNGTADSDLITAGTAAALAVHAGDGDDIVHGTAGADEIYGEGGDDTLIGGTGSDTYYFSSEAGSDRIVDIGDDNGDIDRIVFDSIAPADVSVFSAEGFLFLRFSGDAGEIVIDSDAASDTGIERVLFADATEWDNAQLLALAQPLVTAAPLEVEPEPPAESGGSGESAGGGSSTGQEGDVGSDAGADAGDSSESGGRPAESGEPPAENAGAGGEEPPAEDGSSGSTVADGGSSAGDPPASDPVESADSGSSDTGDDPAGSGQVADAGAGENENSDTTAPTETAGSGGEQALAEGGSSGGTVVADSGTAGDAQADEPAEPADSGTGDTADNSSGTQVIADSATPGNSTGENTMPDPAPTETAGSAGSETDAESSASGGPVVADGGASSDAATEAQDTDSPPAQAADAAEGASTTVASVGNEAVAEAESEPEPEPEPEPEAQASAVSESVSSDGTAIQVADDAENMPAHAAVNSGVPTRPRSTAQARGTVLLDAEPVVPVAVSREPHPIEAFFNRVTPPPLPQQQWLDNWLPSGGRAAAARTESGAPRIAAPTGDEPSAPPAIISPTVPALAPNDAEARNFTPDEIALRYEQIDAWLAAHDGADPDELAGAGPAVFAGGGAAGLWSGVASLDSGAGRIASGGIADLSGGALRSLRGLDEGFSRLG